MNTDFSVAPEIAQLTDRFAPHVATASRTDGRIAGDLADLAATPQRWWDLVRFDERGPVRIPLPDAPGAWLLVLPPGATAECDCRQATALAGEAVEIAGGLTLSGHAGQANAAAAGHPLRPGRVRVHGTGVPHRVCAISPGYSVTLCFSPGA
ncbi:MAG TPA: hypothetical protein VFO01_12055 [Trebonia sp.]|nr:hypothetical protein [Trebonia sp.]